MEAKLDSPLLAQAPEKRFRPPAETGELFREHPMFSYFVAEGKEEVKKPRK
jgi:hypothetical protein